MILSFLKQYRSPTAVLVQWWCLFAARHPRTALALKVMGLYLILAAVTDPVVHAEEAKKSSGGDAFTLFLDTSNLKDKEGIELNRYSTLPLDRGDAFTFNKTIIANIVDFMWGLHYGMVSLALSLLHYVLSFEWLDWLLSPFMFIGSQISPLMERMNIHPLILTLAASVFCVAFFMMRRRGAALAELIIILSVVSLASGSALLSNPIAKLREHTGDDGSKQTGWLLNSTTWASDIASEIYLHDKKKEQVEASGMSPGITNQKPQDIITRSLGSVLVREPYQVVAFGQNLDGKCKNEFNSMVRDKDYKDVASNDRRDAITSSGGCSDTKKWVDNPDLYRAVLLATYTLGALAPLFLVAVFIVLIFKSVFDACVNALLATVYAWYAMLPMVDRKKFFHRAIGTFFACLQVGVLIGVLILYLYILEQFYDATVKWAPILRSIVMAVLIFLLAKKSWEFFRERGLDGSALADRLSRMGLKSSSGAAMPVRFAGAPAAFSPHAISMPSVGGRGGSGGGGAVSTMGGAGSGSGSGGGSRGSKLLAPINSFRAKRQPAYAASGVPQNHAAMRQYMGPATTKHYRSARNLSRKGRALKYAGTAVALVPGGFAPGIGMRLTGAAMQHRGEHRMRKVESEYAYPTFSVHDQLRQSEEDLRRRKEQEEQAERERKENKGQEKNKEKEEKKRKKDKDKDKKG